MVAHVLNELGGPLDKVALARLELAVDQLVVCDLDLDETSHPDGTLAGEAALLGLEGTHAEQDLGVVHHERVALVVGQGTDGLGHTDLVGSQAGGVLDGQQGIHQVLRNFRVGGGGRLTRGGEDGLILHELLDHGRSFLIWAQQILAHSFLSSAELYQMPIKARAASPQNELN